MADSKKKLTKVVAVATAAALLLGGTFAWQSISQTALNEASDVINPGGRLHDDFYIDDNGNYNSDIYVENFADDEIFARVRVEEYFDIVTNKGLVDANGNLLETVDTVAGSKTLKDGATVDPVNNPTGANLYDYEYELHYFDQTNATDEYWTLTPGDVDSETVYYMPTFNKNKDSLVPDRNGMYVDRVGGISDQSPDQYDDYHVWSDGEESTEAAIYDADSDDIDQYAEGNGAVDVNWIEVEETHTAQAVGTSNGLISMSEWQELLANGEYTGEYWVYDEDGWVYWTSPIAKDSATGLLLDSISLNKVMDDSWYYAINVIGQFVTANDLGSEEDGTGFYDTTDGPAPTDNALALLKEIGVDVNGEAGGGNETPDAGILSLTPVRDLDLAGHNEVIAFTAKINGNDVVIEDIDEVNRFTLSVSDGTTTYTVPFGEWGPERDYIYVILQNSGLNVQKDGTITLSVTYTDLDEGINETSNLTFNVIESMTTMNASTEEDIVRDMTWQDMVHLYLPESMNQTFADWLGDFTVENVNSKLTATVEYGENRIDGLSFTEDSGHLWVTDENGNQYLGLYPCENECGMIRAYVYQSPFYAGLEETDYPVRVTISATINETEYEFNFDVYN